MKNLLIRISHQVWVAQATRLCRPATGRTEWKELTLFRNSQCVSISLTFRAASRRSAQAGRLFHPFFAEKFRLNAIQGLRPLSLNFRGLCCLTFTLLGLGIPIDGRAGFPPEIKIQPFV